MNRVLIDLGFVQIYWYSICILIGMMIGMFLVYKETIKKDISDNLVTNLIFYTIIISIIGARLYYVIFDWKSYASNPIEILEIWNGGLAIHGAIIFGGLFLIYYTRHNKMDTLKILDICSVGLIIGQAIGRWGNFFNQEVYGGKVTEAFLKGLHLPGFIIDGMYIGGKYRQPLFLYESLWCILGFIILLIIRRRKYIKTGQIFGSYCIWYSIGRFVLEGMRVKKYNLMIGPLKVAQVVSIGMFLVGIFFVIRRIKTSRFEYLYNDEKIATETTEEKEENKPFYGSKLELNINNNSSEGVVTNKIEPSMQTTQPVQSTNPVQLPVLIQATIPVQTIKPIEQTIPKTTQVEQHKFIEEMGTTPAETIPQTVPEKIEDQIDDLTFQQSTGPVLNNSLNNNDVKSGPMIDQNNTQA